MIDYEKTIISQFSNSPVIVQLIENMNSYIDQSANFDAFLSYVWNVDTAQGFGLDIWGRIVGITRNVSINDVSGCFGFQTPNASNDFLPFEQGVFYDPSAQVIYNQPDDDYRKLILAKALANISQCTAPAINQLLKNIFAGRGRCYVNDYSNMTCKCTFEFSLTPVEKKILENQIIPHPSGVLMTYEEIGQNVGFVEMGDGAYPFDDGTWRV